MCPAGRARSRSARVAGVGVGQRRGVDGGLGPPHAARPPRACSRRRARSASTSQYRVGMGRPSSSSGAFSMTAGVPSRRRTTTVKAPDGGRPSSRATASRSDSPSGRGGGLSSRTPGSGPPVPSSCGARAARRLDRSTTAPEPPACAPVVALGVPARPGGGDDPDERLGPGRPGHHRRPVQRDLARRRRRRARRARGAAGCRRRAVPWARTRSRGGRGRSMVAGSARAETWRASDSFSAWTVVSSWAVPDRAERWDSRPSMGKLVSSTTRANDDGADQHGAGPPALERQRRPTAPPPGHERHQCPAPATRACAGAAARGTCRWSRGRCGRGTCRCGRGRCGSGHRTCRSRHVQVRVPSRRSLGGVAGTGASPG